MRMAERRETGGRAARDLVDPGRYAPLGPADDPRMPTLMGKYKVPHFDVKGEANHVLHVQPACRRLAC